MHPPEGKYISPYPDPEYWDKHINGMILKQHADIIQGDVLNLGCNHGAETQLIKRLPNVKWVEGMDMNLEAIKMAEQLYPDTRFYFHDIRMPWWRHYDTIVALHILEHIDLIEDALENIDAVLYHGGHLVVSVPYGAAYGPSVYHLHEFNELTLALYFEKDYEILQLYRDQRVDGHGNEHDVLNLIARKNSEKIN